MKIKLRPYMSENRYLVSKTTICIIYHLWKLLIKTGDDYIGALSRPEDSVYFLDVDEPLAPTVEELHYIELLYGQDIRKAYEDCIQYTKRVPAIYL